jgi:NAD(P)-dependent dehydrogenase (short-subunit alcohol dehydrogenase family)
VEGTVSAGPVPPGWPRKAPTSRRPTLIRPQLNRWIRVPHGRHHLAVLLAVTDASLAERAFADAASELVGIDVLINVAAGDTYHRTFEETTDEGSMPPRVLLSVAGS